MSFERIFISLPTLCEELGIDPERFLCVENAVDVPADTWGRGKGQGIVVVLEPKKELRVAQTSGTFPQLKTKPKGGKKKRGC